MKKMLSIAAVALFVAGSSALACGGSGCGSQKTASSQGKDAKKCSACKPGKPCGKCAAKKEAKKCGTGCTKPCCSKKADAKK